MASLKANGGVYRLLELLIARSDGSEARVKIAICENGKVLRNLGAGWKVARASRLDLTREQFVDYYYVARGYRVDDSAAARGVISRSEADAHAHKHALRRLRLR